MNGKETRLLRIVEGGSGHRSERMVACPRSGELLELSRKVTCVYCDGVALDPRGGGFVQCQWPGHAERDAPRTAASRIPVAVVMTSSFVSVGHRTPIHELLQQAADRPSEGVVVTEDDGQPVGMISTTALLRLAMAGTRLEATGAPWRAADVMTPLVRSVPEHGNIAYAAALMVAEKTDLLPVVDRTGRFAGLLSSTDLLRWLARREGYAVA